MKTINRYSAQICSILAILAISSMVVIRSLRVGNIAPAAAKITNWGLSFQTEGEAPIGNATVEQLAKYNGLYYVPEEEKTIYLTFDAGYENGYMPEILKILDKHQVKATFFLVGDYFEREPDLVKQIDEAGHTVGNHTLTHPDMAAITSEERFKRELQGCEELYTKITGKRMAKIYRPPQGKFSQANLAMADKLGYKTIFWSLAYVDWYDNQQPSRDEAFAKLLPRIHPGAIVLLHSTSSANMKILDELLTKWREAGYTFGDLEAYLNTGLLTSSAE